MSRNDDSGPHVRYELELEETRDASAERQKALEILGEAIDKLIPGHCASGTVVEHATATAQALLDAFGIGKVVPPPLYPLDPAVEEDIVSMASIVAGNSGSEHDERDIAQSWRAAFEAHGRRSVGVALARLVRAYGERADRAGALRLAEDCDFRTSAELSGERKAFIDATTMLLAHTARIP